jgi:hypothetical protein
VGGARQDLEGRLDDRVDHRGVLEAARQPLQRLVDLERAAGIVLDLIADRGQVDDRARRDQAIGQLVVGARGLGHRGGQREADPHHDRALGIAEQEQVAGLEQELVPVLGVEGDADAGALDRRAVGRAQIAEAVAAAIPGDLRVLARQVVVGDHHRVGGGAPDGDDRRRQLDAGPGRGAADDLEGEHWWSAADQRRDRGRFCVANRCRSPASRLYSDTGFSRS